MEDDKKATSMNLLGIMMFVAVALLLIIVVVSILVGRTKTGNKPAATTGKNTPVEITPEPTTQVSVLDSMVENGEITGYCRGDTVNVVYKITPSTFDNPEQYYFGVVDNEGHFTLELTNDMDIEKYYKQVCLLKEGGNFYHLKNDIFWQDPGVNSVDSSTEIRLFNAKDFSSTNLEYFKDGYVGNYGYWHDKDYWVSRKAIRKILQEGFHDGLIIVEAHPINEYYDDPRIILIYDDGTLFQTEIYGRFRDDVAGPYKEGLFYAYGNFYDSQGNCVIDLSEYTVENVPEFENGSAYLEIWRNGKLWDVYIDTSGKFIGEPTEHIEKLRENE